MKTILNLLFWLFIALLTSFTLCHCKKTEAEPPIANEKQWYLDFAAPPLDFSVVDIPANAIGTNIGADDNAVGLYLDFRSASFTARLFTEGAGNKITQFSGIIDNHAFLLVDDSLNICSGLQRVYVNFKVEYK